MTLGEIIKEYRNKNGVSMEYVANLCGITKGYVAMLEKNVNSKTGKPVKPTIETIIKVCNGLHLNFDSVFELLDDDYEVTITPPSECSCREQKLRTMFCTLNRLGQDRVLEYVNDICVGGRYHKSDEDVSDSTSYTMTIVDELNAKNKVIEELKKEIEELKDYIDDLESRDLSCYDSDELVAELEARGYGADWDDF